MAECIRLAIEKSSSSSNFEFHRSTKTTKALVTPGDQITNDAGFMRGHGTYDVDDGLYASVAGAVEQVNKLISVKPLKTRYNGEIGDCIVGRITEVQQKRWKVDTNSRLDSVLHLSSVNLPGGELRRRSAEDELLMRQYLQEGDLISAEVQQIHSDGSLSLHTRSLKYGKLSQGTLVRVSPSLIKRSKLHFHDLLCGVSVILGNNGFVWIYPTSQELGEGEKGSSFVQNLEPVPKNDRTEMARVRNCILALSSSRVMLDYTSIVYAYRESLEYKQIKDLLYPEVVAEIAENARHKLSQTDMVE